MYGIGEIIDYIETRKLPKHWQENLDWDEARFVSTASGIIRSFVSDFWLPKNKPFKTPHIERFERRHKLIKCIPELYKVMVFHKNTYTFIDEVDQKKVHQWVNDESTPPRLFISYRR